jgi:hypothetical protein
MNTHPQRLRRDGIELAITYRDDMPLVSWAELKAKLPNYEAFLCWMISHTVMFEGVYSWDVERFLNLSD